MLEKDITAAILRYLRSLPECFCWKEHGGSYGAAGIPDIICCYRGRFLGLEVKQLGNKMTRLQEVTLERIRAALGVAHMVTSLAEARAIIKKLEEELR
ncbi:MAG: VRR-NUC domain-containing protein [Firmicutes bacterium]|nr:VRR-NUC domain-containing protein [Bacillota bacterium]